MTFAQINMLFMFLANTNNKTTDNYDSDIYPDVYTKLNRLLFVWRSCHGRLIKCAKFR